VKHGGSANQRMPSEVEFFDQIKYSCAVCSRIVDWLKKDTFEVSKLLSQRQHLAATQSVRMGENRQTIAAKRALREHIHMVIVHASQTFGKLVADDINDVFATLVEHPLLHSLAAYQAGMAEYFKVLCCRRGAYAQLVTNEVGAHAILDKIAIDLRREVRSGIFQVVQDQ
jgi:hypothetical protein